MRILRVIASANPRGGGPIEGLKISASIMREWGHETEVVTLDDPAADFLADFPLPVHAVGKWTRRYGYSPRLVDWISANGARFDAAVIHGLWMYPSVGGRRGLRRADVPYVVFTHGMMDPWFRKKYPLKHVAKQAYWSLFEGKVLRDAEHVLFTTEEERLLAATAFRGPGYREKVVAYGAASPPAVDRADIAHFRNLIPELGDKPYFLFLSRIHPKKGCDLLIDAYAKVAGQAGTPDLVIAGPASDDLKAELQAQASALNVAERIHWPGMLAGKVKYGAYSGAEAFVLPSHQENFGIVVAEALACACPVLISNKVNIWREVVEGGAGLVDADTSAGTERMLQHFLALAPEERDAMKRAGRRLFDSRFTAEAAAGDLLRVLEQVRRR